MGLPLCNSHCHFFVMAGSPYIHPYFDFSTMATSSQQPKKFMYMDTIFVNHDIMVDIYIPRWL